MWLLCGSRPTSTTTACVVCKELVETVERRFVGQDVFSHLVNQKPSSPEDFGFCFPSPITVRRDTDLKFN